MLRLQHLRNLHGHGLVDRRGRVQRIVPEVLPQLHLTHFLVIVLFTRLLVLLAVVLCVFIHLCLRIGYGVIDDLAEEGVGVELEDGGVGVFEGEVGGEGGEACVPFGNGAGRDGVAPFAGERHSVEGWDVEDEEVASAGHVELW